MATAPNTLPIGKTPTALPAPLDASVAGVILPVVTTDPTDATFGGAAVDGMLVLQAGITDAYYIQWVRINGTWRSTIMGI